MPINIPNFLTVARFCLVPLIIVMIVQGRWTIAFAVFLIAGVTDAIDGFLARRLDQRTEIGAYLDPLADKALLISIYITLSITGVLAPWLAILVVSRDVMIIGAVVLSWIVGDPVEIAPLRVSKANTAAQILFAGLLLGASAFGLDVSALKAACEVVVGLLTLFSLAAYLALWMRHMAE